MSTIVATVLGGAMTILGIVLGFLFQRRQARDVERSDKIAQLRTTRLQAFSEFLGAISHYRRAEMDRWNGEIESGRSDAVKRESYERRATALECLFRVQLLTDNAPVRDAATTVFELTSKIHDAAGFDEFHEFLRGTRRAINEFIEVAARLVGTAEK